MAYSTPSTRATGYVVLATNWNEFVNNFIAMAPDVFTTDGDLYVASAANTGTRIAAFTGSTGTLKHEIGGMEFNANAVTTNDGVGGASAGVMEIKTPVTQAEAEAGTNTRFSLWSSERVKQAIAKLETGNAATGSYTGDGALSQGITGLGFQPVFVWITLRLTNGSEIGGAIWTTDVIVDDNASGQAVKFSDDTHSHDVINNSIISLDSDGFTVDDAGAGPDGHPNKNSADYNFFAVN